MRWFRFYSEALNDPKVQSLSGETYKFWVSLLCLASMNDGVLPSEKDISFACRLRLPAARRHLEKLRETGLLDDNDGVLSPHNWSARQFKSDTSAQRTRRYRERHCDVTDAVTVTAPDTDTDTDTENIKGCADAPPADYRFEGAVIKLKQKDFTRWQSAFTAIPDLAAALQKADSYYQSKPPKDGEWFFRVARWLEKENAAWKKEGGDHRSF